MKALVIEGGGIKAAYATGILMAFEDASYYPWDIIIGTSAGGALAAWYSAKQAKHGRKTWDFVSDPRIVSPWRVLRGKPLLDHEELFELVYTRLIPLDVDEIRKSSCPVIVTACDVDTGELVLLDLREKDAIMALKATGRLPLLSGPPVQFEGRRLLDGGVLTPIPARVAWELGATEILVLSNNPLHHNKSHDPKIFQEVASRKYPKLRVHMYSHNEYKLRDLHDIQNPPAGVKIDILAPPERTGLGRLSQDLELVEKVIQQGYQVGMNYLKGLSSNQMVSSKHS